jgi:hypothetical protein
MKKFGAVFRQSLRDFPCMVALGKNIPSFGLHRFDKSLRFVPPDDEGFSLRGDRQRLLYKGRRRSHRFTILGDTAFEYDCILEREPESNVVSLLMEGAEYYDFFRQPDFVKEPLLKGSYAVYKKETLLGEGTGKLCHIHRPEIIDARGRRCWGDLSVVGNELRITVPEKWLCEAKYPVIIDPNIGTSTVGSQLKGPNPDNDEYDRPMLEGHIAVCKYPVIEKGNGQCTAYVYVYPSDDFDASVLPVLFTDVSNKPYRRISKKHKTINTFVPGNISGKWCSNTFELSDNIQPNSNVWFGISAGYFSTRFDYGGDCYKIINDEDLWLDDDLPEYVTFNPKWDTYQNIKFSWYFNYTAVISQTFVRTLTQGVNLNDRRKLKTDYTRYTAQTVNADCACSRFETFCRECLMAVHTATEIDRFPVFIRIIGENIRLAVANSVSLALKRLCSDNATVHTETIRISDVCREIMDGINGIDGQSCSIQFLRLLPDKVNAVHHASHWWAYVRGLIDFAGTEDETAQRMDYCRINTDTVKAEDNAVRKLLICIRLISKAVVKDLIINRFLKAKQEMVIKSCVVRELAIESRIGNRGKYEGF